MAVLLPALTLVCGTLDTPWMDASLPIPRRVSLLMDRMTLTERARQTYAVHNLPEFVGDFKKSLGKTSFGSLKLSAIDTQIASEQVAIRNELQAFVVNSSLLHIPVSFHNEILLSAAPQATNFPLPVALGASFNESLVKSVHEVLAAETRASGVDVGYAPEVNLYVDARFGRLQEGFSEGDPPCLRRDSNPCALRIASAACLSRISLPDLLVCTTYV
jgi:beta-glucosidase-like glycosyl hydrolase